MPSSKSDCIENRRSRSFFIFLLGIIPDASEQPQLLSRAYHEVRLGANVRNQCLDRLAGFPGSDAVVARDEHGKVNFGCDAHDGVRHSIPSAMPEIKASVSSPGAFCPTGCADKPSGTVSHGGCGITSCQEGDPAHYPSLGISCGGCDRVHFRKCIELEQRGV